MIDGREQDLSMLTGGAIRQLCQRRLGIGADGLIILEESGKGDFRMRYYNADGMEGTMCGNGGRCITLFASHLGLIGEEAIFEGIDGIHHATLLPDGHVRLKLTDVEEVQDLGDGYLLDTGSPHFVTFVPGIESRDVEKEGAAMRNQSRFGKSGTNINFVEPGSGTGEIRVRTYERGVEAETLSCGTGVTAAAICAFKHLNADIFTWIVQTLGGTLKVDFTPQGKNHFTEIHLTGPAVKVFEGDLQF